MLLSVCMIVKNEEKTLATTLPGLARYADEIILIDTGSSDGTIALAEKYGAKVAHFAWVNDYSKARNESLKHAKGNWILWVDADEFIKEEDLQTLVQRLKESSDEAHAFTMYESDYGKCEKKFNYLRVKVFKNQRGFHFVRPINEQLVNSQGEVAKGSLLPVAIYHWGRYLEKERLLEKRKRYVEQFTRAIEKSPEDACFHFLLANVLRDLGQTAEAILIYRKVIALSHDRVLSRQALERIAQIYFKNKKFSAAADAARELLAFDPENIYALNIFASLFLMSGRTDDAIEALHMVLAKTKNIEIEDPYQSQALPHLLLGEAYMHKNEKEKAELHLSYAKRVFPYLTGDN